MKKQLVATLAAAFVFGVAGSAFAAANPFVDVPAKHWAYDSVTKLAQAGIVDGYNDGTFRGDRTMTRYEMAQIVAKAMTKTDKADAETRAIVDKLAVEFADELNNLGVRVTKLENKVGNIKIAGETRLKYQDVDSDPADFKGSDAFDWRQRLVLSADVAPNIEYGARIEAKGTFGSGSQQAKFNRNFIAVKDSILGLDKVTLGKFGLATSRNLAIANSSDNDGVVINHKFGATNMQAFFVNPADVTVDATKNIEARKDAEVSGIDFAYAANKNFDFNVGYIGYEQDNFIDAGFGYQFAKNFTLTGEYVDSDNDVKEDGSAYAAQLVWNSNGTKANKLFPYSDIVNKKNAHEYAFAVGYADIEKNALPNNGGLTSFKGNATGFTALGNEADNAKVLTVGYQAAMQKNLLLNLEYYDLEQDNGSLDDKAAVAYVQFFF